MNEPTRATDEKLLLMLDLRYNEGLTGKRLQATAGMTTGAVAGACMRIRNAELPDDCVKPKNQTGGMPRGWWKS